MQDGRLINRVNYIVSVNICLMCCHYCSHQYPKVTDCTVPNYGDWNTNQSCSFILVHMHS